MVIKKYFTLVLLLLLVPMTGCSLLNDVMAAVPAFDPGFANTPILDEATHPPQPPSSSPTASPTHMDTPTPTATEVIYDIGKELTLQYLWDLEITGSEITFERQLAPTFYYEQSIVSYISEGNKIFGLLTIPRQDPPDNGFKAIIFNHGYIPPATYRTTERYYAYVDYLARSGFVVFKIDFRGHGESEGEPQGSYFSPGYTIDAIAALKSLQTLDFIDPEGIGMWGHSMAGNLTLRAMLIEPEIKAGVIWAGAVYSYDDFAEYGIDDNTYRPPATPQATEQPRRSQQIFDAYGRPDSGHPYWLAVSLTENIGVLESPLQIHHALDDTVVRIDYSYGLVAALQEMDMEYEFYIYESGGHNLISPSFGLAMVRTVQFFKDNL